MLDPRPSTPFREIQWGSGFGLPFSVNLIVLLLPLGRFNNIFELSMAFLKHFFLVYLLLPLGRFFFTLRNSAVPNSRFLLLLPLGRFINVYNWIREYYPETNAPSTPFREIQQ
jgi:hypothetical protein